MSGPDPNEVARAKKLLEKRGTGDLHRKVAVEMKIKQLPDHVHAAAKAHSASKGGSSHRAADGHPSPGGGGGHAHAGAQMEMTTDFMEDDPNLLFRDHQMGRLPQKMGGTRLGWPLNEDAKQLLKRVDQADVTAKDLKGTLDFLRWQENENLPRILKGVEQESQEIGRRAEKDPHLADAIEKYAQTGPELGATVDKVTASHKSLLSAAKDLKVAHDLQDERAAKADVSAREDKVKEVQQKAQELRDRVGKVIGYAEDLIKDPGSYTKILKDAGQYLEGKALDFLLGDVYGPELKEAQDALEAAKKNLKNIQSSIDVDRIASATDKLDAAQAKFSANLKELKAALKRVEATEHTVIKKLEAMGGGAATAAKAVESRRETVESAQKGMQLVTTYLELCTKIGHDASGLARKYNDYWTTLQKDRARLQEDPPLTDEAKTRLLVQGIAEKDELVVKKIADHAVEERQLAVSAQAYLKGETYLRLYEDIENTLHRAVGDR
jgi:hypothetical protein